MGKLIEVPVKLWTKKKDALRAKEVEYAQYLIEQIRQNFDAGFITTKEADTMYQTVIERYKLSPKEA